jgi:hypothetical protein
MSAVSEHGRSMGEYRRTARKQRRNRLKSGSKIATSKLARDHIAVSSRKLYIYQSHLSPVLSHPPIYKFQTR